MMPARPSRTSISPSLDSPPIPAESKPSRISFFESVRPYNRAWLSRDIVAGVTLAALAIPEVMGYTKIAGTPVITGLYTILIPALAFAVFGSSRHLVVGGDSATAAIMYPGIAGLGVSGLKPETPQWLALASMSALLAAGFLLLARVARLGFLANFISRTVLVGFLTGVGVQVALGQFAGMLGVPSPKVSVDHVSGTLIKFWDTLAEIGSPFRTRRTCRSPSRWNCPRLRHRGREMTHWGNGQRPVVALISRRLGNRTLGRFG
jgi:MFS superfamily sulfate permease-like transporter